MIGCIYNGVPEWNYEEEMLSDTKAIWWSPDGEMFAYLSFDVSKVDLLQYSVYPKKTASPSPDQLIDTPDYVEQYNQVNPIRYAKPTRNITTTKFYLTKLVTGRVERVVKESFN